MFSIFKSPLHCLLALALLLSACAKKSDPTEATKRFFEQIAAGKIQSAYDSTAFGFQAQQSANAFAVTVKEMGLTDYASAHWQPLEIKEKTAKLRVEVKTRAGREMPLVVTLTDESGAWRIFSLRSPRNVETGLAESRFSLIGKSSAFTEATDQPIPSEKEVRALVLEALLNFNSAIAQKSFDEFYDFVARSWQDQLTKGQLQRAFEPFIEKEVSIAGISGVEAVLDAPAVINTEGLLIVSGSYPTNPYRVFFSLKFRYELPKWRLFGIDVNLRK